MEQVRDDLQEAAVTCHHPIISDNSSGLKDLDISKTLDQGLGDSLDDLGAVFGSSISSFSATHIDYGYNIV
jgi:hypothetical protein